MLPGGRPGGARGPDFIPPVVTGPARAPVVVTNIFTIVTASGTEAPGVLVVLHPASVASTSPTVLGNIITHLL